MGEFSDSRAASRLSDVGESLSCSTADELLNALDSGARRVELVGPWADFTASLGDELWLTTSRLKGLRLLDCCLDASALCALSTALPPSLVAFGVRNNPGISVEVWRSVWRSLPSGVRELDLGSNKFADQHLSALCEGFLALRGSSLRELRLDGNKFRSLTALTPVLGAMERLASVDLSDNAIDDDGLLPFAQALSHTGIRFLNLSGNAGISSRSAATLFSLLPRVASLEALHLDGTAVDDDGLEALQTCLADSSLKELSLQDTRLTDAGVCALVPYIQDSSLSMLDVGRVDAEGWQGQLAQQTMELLSAALAPVRKPTSEKMHVSAAPQRSTVDDSALTIVTALAAPKSWEAQSYLRRQDFGRVPSTMKVASRRLAEEVEYVSSFSTLHLTEPKTRLVRLFTAEEKTAIVQGLQSQLQRVEGLYKRDLASASKSAYAGVKDCVVKKYEPQLLKIRQEIENMDREYIFVDC